VQLDVKERAVALGDQYATFLGAAVPAGGQGKGYYELEILQRDGLFPQHSFAEPLRTCSGPGTTSAPRTSTKEANTGATIGRMATTSA
jgi:hypothetical protein